MKTPEGIFTVLDIYISQSWVYVFRDGKGKIKGAYGPYFIRLDVPMYKGIGIPGRMTPYPLILGSRKYVFG